MQFQRLPYELLISIVSYLPKDHLKKLITMPELRPIYEIYETPIVQESTDSNLPPENRAPPENRIYRDVLLHNYPAIKEYLVPISNDKLYNMGILLENIIKEADESSLTDFAFLDKMGKDVTAEYRMDKIPKQSLDWHDKNVRDYFSMMGTIKESHYNKLIYNYSNDSLRLILLDSSVDINYIPYKGMLTPLEMSEEYGSVLSTIILLSDYRTDNTIKNNMLINTSKESGGEFEDALFVKELLMRIDYTVSVKEKALKDTYMVMESSPDENEGGPDGNIILLLTSDIRVNPSVENNKPLFIMMYTVGGPSYEGNDTEDENYHHQWWDDIETLMSRPRFDFNARKDSIIYSANEMGYPNVSERFTRGY